MATNHPVTRRALVAGAAALLAAPVRAQEAWAPSRPVRLIVPWPPGGTTDTLGRLFAGRVTEGGRTIVVVENRGGAGGVVGTEALVRSAPDGYTLGLIISTHAANASLVERLPFDPLRDVQPIAMLARAPNLITVHASSPIRSLAALVEASRATPGGLAYATSGIGTGNHFAGELLRMRTGAALNHVPYRGGAPAVADALSNTVPVMVGAFAIMLPHVQSGALRALATTGAQRSALLPDVPTVAESGMPGFEVVEWYGCAAPAGIPEAARAHWEAEALRFANRPETVARLATLGVEASPMGSNAFGGFIAAEVTKFREIVRAANMTTG